MHADADGGSKSLNRVLLNFKPTGFLSILLLIAAPYTL